MLTIGAKIGLRSVLMNTIRPPYQSPWLRCLTRDFAAADSTPKEQPASPQSIPSSAVPPSKPQESGEPKKVVALFKDLAATFERISETKSRKEGMLKLAETFKRYEESVDTLRSVFKICTCTIRPSYEKERQQLMISNKGLEQALQRVFQLTEKELAVELKQTPDLGVLGAQLAKSYPKALSAMSNPGMTCDWLVDELSKLYSIKGKDSNELRTQTIESILLLRPSIP